MKRTAQLVAAPLFLLALAACGDQAPPEEPIETEVEMPDQVADPVVDTTAEALQAHLESENYSENWAHWPDLEPFYGGGEPHGMLLATYVNDAAMRGIERLRAGQQDDLPFNSILVKENYAPDSTLVAVTTMYKREQYDPANHDWFWVKRLADGTVEASGRVGGCISCHGQAADRWDYLMTAQAQYGN